MRSSILQSVLFLLLMPSASWASTVPPLDLPQHKGAIAAGIYDLSLDFALSNHFSFGISSVAPFDSYRILAFRVLYVPLGSQANPCFGLAGSFGTAPSAGIFRPYNGDDATFPVSYTAWVQPALAFSANFSALPLPISLRATVGPIFPEPQIPPYLPSFLKYAWPNVEIAYRFNDSNELTIGGNSIIGWRWRPVIKN